MTDDRHATGKAERKEQGNLGQKQAKREEEADEKLEHMDQKKPVSKEQSPQSQKQQKK